MSATADVHFVSQYMTNIEPFLHNPCCEVAEGGKRAARRLMHCCGRAAQPRSQKPSLPDSTLSIGRRFRGLSYIRAEGRRGVSASGRVAGVESDPPRSPLIQLCTHHDQLLGGLNPTWAESIAAALVTASSLGSFAHSHFRCPGRSA